MQRMTRQRSAVSELLAEVDDFSSAQHLHELLRERGQEIGLATVYRTLQSLADGGERLQRPVDGGQADLLAAFAQQLVQVLGRAEVVDLREQLGGGGALSGHPLHHRGSPEVSTTSSATSGCGSRVPPRRARTRSGRTAATSAYRPMARTTMVAPGEASCQ